MPQHFEKSCLWPRLGENTMEFISLDCTCSHYRSTALSASAVTHRLLCAVTAIPHLCGPHPSDFSPNDMGSRHKWVLFIGRKDLILIFPRQLRECQHSRIRKDRPE